MSDCSTHKDEYPGVKRIIVHFTDPNEHDFEWPFVPLEREIAYIMVDGETWVCERTCRNLDKHHNIMFKCSECGHWECQDFDGEKILPQTWNYCPHCGAKVRNE